MKRKPYLEPALLNEALSWAIESMDAMIDAHSGPSWAPAKKSLYVAGLIAKRQRLKDYQTAEFGPRHDPLICMTRINAFDLPSLGRRTFRPPPLNGEKTHPLSTYAIMKLRELRDSGPIPGSQINAGVANRFFREDLAFQVQRPSPFVSHNGKKIMHLQITKQGRAALKALGK